MRAGVLQTKISPWCARAQVIRSFDVNKPGTPFEDLKGAVMGGVLDSGMLRIGQRIEIRPGLIRMDRGGQRYYQPLYSRVVSLLSDTNPLTHAIPGGLVGVGTLLGPKPPLPTTKTLISCESMAWPTNYSSC
jgi:translation initiation factor 2 gamma subunit (eIF-2gamma)